MIRQFIIRPVFTTMLILVLIVFGIKSYPTLGVDLYPEVDLPLVSVTVTYTGAAPEEMETLVTKPIENRVSQVSGIKAMSSTMRSGYSQTVLEFDYGVDPKEKASEVREKVASVRGRLPDNIDEPIVQRVDLSAQAIMAFTLASKTRSRGEIVRLIEDVIKTRLQQVEGVSEVDYYGAGNREFKIWLDPEKLKAYKIPLQKVYSAVNEANINTPGGSVDEHGTRLTVRTIGKLKNIDEFKSVVISNDEGRVVKLNDIARIEDGWEEEVSYARSNKVPSVMVMVRKQSGTNTVAAIDGVKEALEELGKDQMPADIEIAHLRDTSTYIRDNVADVWSSILFGGFLALLITYYFLQNFRATIIGGMAIPTSIIATFFLMKNMHFTINNMSLMGMSLAVGMLIDDAIVLIENIFRHMEMGKSSIKAAQEATEELSLAIIATSLSLMAVFVPIGSMGEVVGQFFAQFGLTVAFALAFSTFSAYSLTPMLSAYWLQRPKEVGSVKNPRNKYLQWSLDKFENGFQAFRSFYNDIMSVAVEHPKKVVVAAFATMIVNFALMPFLGFEFQPTYDSGEFMVSLKAPSGITISQMRKYVDPIETIIMQEEGVRVVGMRLGGTRVSPNQSTIEVKLLPVDQRKRSMTEIMDSIRSKLRDYADLKVAVMSGQGTGRGDRRPVQIGVRGSDLKQLEIYANELADKIRQVPGATDVDLSLLEAEPEVIIRVDQEKASRFGLNAASIGDMVQLAYLGRTTTNNFTYGDNDFDIRVELEQANQKGIEEIKNLQVSTVNGQFVSLGDIAKVTLESGPTQIDREDKERQIVVYSNVEGTSAGELGSIIRNDILPTINFQQGYHTKFLGQSDMMAKSFTEIAKALILAIIIIYMVLAGEFESFGQPIVIIVSLPFALVGAIAGLLVTGLTVNMMSLIGFTMLLGLVTKTAILLVDYTNQARDGGMELKAAVLEGCSLRLRPILMTSLSTILGMMPIALGLGAGAELRQSMGVVLVGGMFTSTFLTLVVVPLVYLLFERAKISYYAKKNTQEN